MNPLDHGGGADERIVGPEGAGAVARCPANAKPPPCNTLLTDVHANDRRFGRTGVQSSVLGQDVVGLDRVGVVIGHPLGAVGRARLLVGDAEVDQVTLRAESRVGQVAERDGHRRGEVEHVDRATAPDLSVYELPSEGVARPPVRVDRNDIGVAHQAQGRRIGIAPLDPSDQRRPVGCGLERLDVDSGSLDDLLQ